MTDGFDAGEFAIELGEAGQALIALAQGPGQVAADVIAGGFERASVQIERALLQAARTGEVSFDALFRRILDDLARLAAQAVVDASGLSGARGRAGGGLPHVVFNIGGGTDGASFIGQQGRIGQMLAGAMRSGGRFS